MPKAGTLPPYTNQGRVGRGILLGGISNRAAASEGSTSGTYGKDRADCKILVFSCEVRVEVRDFTIAILQRDGVLEKESLIQP